MHGVGCYLPMDVADSGQVNLLYGFGDYFNNREMYG